MSANSKLEALRLQIRTLEGHRLETNARVLPFADARLNESLPGGGLALGALHEFCAGGLEGELAPAVTAFAAIVAAKVLHKHDGFLLWAACQADCYAPGLACLGLDPSRIVWVDCAKEAEVLSVMEEALHSRAVPAVLGEAGALNLKTARRLDAAARQSGGTALLLRRHHSKPADAGLLGCGAAATRWRVSAVASERPPHPCPLSREGRGERPLSGHSLPPLPSRERVGVRGASGRDAPPEPGLGPPRFRLDLEYCRNGRTASWIVEVSDGARFDNKEAGHVRVVAELRDDACAPPEAPAREGQRAARAY